MDQTFLQLISLVVNLSNQLASLQQELATLRAADQPSSAPPSE